MPHKHSKSIVARFSRCRQHHPRRWHVLVGAVFGIIFEVLLSAFRPALPAVNEMEAAFADWMIRFWVQREPAAATGGVENPYYPFVLVNIDEQTYESLNAPLTIPRGVLWELLARAIEGNPALVILDLALDRSLKEAGDNKLRDCLRKYAEVGIPLSGSMNARSPDESCFKLAKDPKVVNRPHILLPASFRSTSSSTGDNDVLKQERPSDFLSDIVARSNHIHWTSTTVKPDDDYVVRKWQLFETALVGPGGDKRVFPSMPLLAWGILRKPNIGDASFSVPRFTSCLNQEFGSGNVDGTEPCPVPATPSAVADEYRAVCFKRTAAGLAFHDPVLRKTVCISEDPTELKRRVLYPLGDVTEACNRRELSQRQIDPWVSPYITFNREPIPLVKCFSALDILNLNEEVLPTLFEGRVVIIGVSYADSRDFHVTPVGRVPGAVWIINAMQALMQYGQMTELPEWVEKPLLLVVIVGVAIIFAWLTPLVATVVAVGFIALTMGLLGLLLFTLGTWLDLVAPLVGVMVHHMFSDLLDERFALLRDKHGA